MTAEERNERCVFVGERIKVYQRDQEQFDGSMKVYERFERWSSTAILPIKDGNILLAYQKQSHKKDWYWSHVGGYIEPGEEPIVGAKREMLEETGMDASFFELYWKESNQRNQRYVFVGKGLVKVADQTLDAGELIELKRVSIDEYFDMLIHGRISSWDGREKEIMLKIIDGGIDEFKEYLMKT